MKNTGDKWNESLIITIFGIKLRFRKRNFNLRFLLRKIITLNNQIALENYLGRKYLYAAKSAEKELQNIPENERNVMTDKIWTMWLQEDVPEIIQMCLDSIKRIYPETVIITEKNLSDYVDVPDHIYKKYSGGGDFPNAFFRLYKGLFIG